MSAKRIHIGITMESRGTRKTTEFNGSAYLDSGFLTGLIAPGEGSWSEAERILLTAFTLTGCPLAARSERPGLNPWVLTNGAYNGRRELETTSFLARSSLASRPTPDCLEMDLMIKVCGTLPLICGVAEPFQESIRQEPGSSFCFHGDFAIKFATVGGTEIVNAKTEYMLMDLKCQGDLPPVWRNITIMTPREGAAIRQVEQIDLFGDEGNARRDLGARLSVN